MIALPTLIGTLKKERKNKGKEDKIEFIRHTLPIKDKVLCFHPNNIFENFWNTDCQVSTSLGFAPMGMR